MTRKHLGTVLLLAATMNTGRAFGGDADKPGPAAAGVPSATEVFQKAASAVKAAKLFRYRAEYKAEGWVTAFVANVTGTVTVGQQSDQGIERFSCQAKIKPPKSEETLEFTAASDGDNYVLVDPKTKTVYEDMDPGVLGSQSRNIRRVVMTELGVPEPFSKELKTEKIEVKGITKVGDEECFEVLAAAPNTPELTWYIAKKDFLPRKLTRKLTNEKNEVGTTELTLSEFVANPKDAKDPFKLPVPEGYKKTSDFAP